MGTTKVCTVQKKKQQIISEKICVIDISCKNMRPSGPS